MGIASDDELEPVVAAAGQESRSSQPVGRDRGWFTEGFDTKNLQEAKALLEELS